MDWDRGLADARAADVLPIIRALQANGAGSLRAIAAGLNEQGIPTARGGEWSAVHVMRVLERARQTLVRMFNYLKTTDVKVVLPARPGVLFHRFAVYFSTW